MSRDGRAAVRQRERSQLVVTGVDAQGRAFEERTNAVDISEEGLSFYLRQPLWLSSHLTTELVSSNLFTSNQVKRAMVVRIHVDPSGTQFVAARFNE